MTASIDNPAPPTHAGGIVWRDAGGRIEYLLVRARSDREEWVLPKGHIEAGESAEQAALREVREEAGASCRVVARVGAIEYGHAGSRVRVVFYLMRLERMDRAEEDRELRWCTPAEARRVLTHADARALLERAEALRAAADPQRP